MRTGSGFEGSDLGIETGPLTWVFWPWPWGWALALRTGLVVLRVLIFALKQNLHTGHENWHWRWGFWPWHWGWALDLSVLALALKLDIGTWGLGWSWGFLSWPWGRTLALAMRTGIGFEGSGFKSQTGLCFGLEGYGLDYTNGFISSCSQHSSTTVSKAYSFHVAYLLMHTASAAHSLLPDMMSRWCCYIANLVPLVSPDTDVLPTVGCWYRKAVCYIWLLIVECWYCY